MHKNLDDIAERIAEVGRVRSISPLMMLKIAVFAPMPRTRMRTATVLKLGLLRRVRSA